MLPRLEIVARRRPVDLVAPGEVQWRESYSSGETTGAHPLAVPAPFAGIVLDVGPGIDSGRLLLTLSSGATRLQGWCEGDRFGLIVGDPSGHETRHASRRRGRCRSTYDRVGLTLTGRHLTVWAHAATPGGDPRWTAMGRVYLADRVPVHDETWLAGLTAAWAWSGSGRRVHGVTAGGFGQLGFRDVRLVTEADGTPVRDGEELLFTATHAGPGFFDTAHTGVWALHPGSLQVQHRGDLYFRRPDRPGVYGDHATHLMRDGDRWLVTTSTWGDFHRAGPDARMRITLAEVPESVDPTRGSRVLDTRWLDLPTAELAERGAASVGVWDPHLVRTGTGWLVGFVSARKWFVFHPAVAEGPSLDALTLRSVDPHRRATEGTTLLRLDGDWSVLASDGRDGRRDQRARYPVFDLDLNETGVLDAPYPSNLPWPTLAQVDGSWLLLLFNGETAGGPLLGYGTHGQLLIAREVAPARTG